MKIEDVKTLYLANEAAENINRVMARVEEARERFFLNALGFFSGLGVPMPNVQGGPIFEACNMVVDSVIAFGGDELAKIKLAVEPIDKDAADSLGKAVAIEEPK